MKVKRTSLSDWIALISVSLTFLGQKVILLLMAFLGALSLSRYLTISIRLSIGLLLILMMLIQVKKKILLNKVTFFYIWFCASLGISIFFDISNENYDNYYLSNLEVVGYFVLFSILPFFAIINSRFSLNLFDKIIKYFMILGFLFSFMSIYVYRAYIGSVGRLSSNSVGDDNILSPLILSYCSALIIVLGITFLITHKVRIVQKISILITIAISTIPFFLGSSRGSLLAIAVSLMSVVLFKAEGKGKIKIITAAGVMVAFGVYIMNSIQSNLLMRIEKIQEIDDGDGRIIRYLESISIINDNPIFGNGLVLQSFDNYPHNIFLEVIQASGLFGFIPFLVLIIFGLKSAKNIFLKNPKYSWLAVLFIQSFMGNMLSGSVITASWFWFSLALVISFDKQFNSFHKLGLNEKTNS